MPLASLLAVQLLLAAAPPALAVPHLQDGARAFREARYDRALVEFRVAEALGAAEAGPYAAAALLKLGRAEEAVESFAGGETGGDALLDYYRALACYEARLYLCADGLLASFGARSGPRLAEEAARIRAAIAVELGKEPPQASVDWYLARCGERRQAGRPLLAGAYCREAVGLARRRPDQYRLAEAAALLAALPGKPGAGQ